MTNSRRTEPGDVESWCGSVSPVLGTLGQGSFPLWTSVSLFLDERLT